MAWENLGTDVFILSRSERILCLLSMCVRSFVCGCVCVRVCVYVHGGGKGRDINASIFMALDSTAMHSRYSQLKLTDWPFAVCLPGLEAPSKPLKSPRHTKTVKEGNAVIHMSVFISLIQLVTSTYSGIVIASKFLVYHVPQSWWPVLSWTWKPSPVLVCPAPNQLFEQSFVFPHRPTLAAPKQYRRHVHRS